MAKLTDSEGKELITFNQIENTGNYDFQESGSELYHVYLDGKPVSVYMHWSNVDLGFLIYEGHESLSKVLGKVETELGQEVTPDFGVNVMVTGIDMAGKQYQYATNIRYNSKLEKEEFYDNKINIKLNALQSN